MRPTLVFAFPGTPDALTLYAKIEERIKALSEAYGPMRRLLAAEHHPVATWGSCPICESAIARRVEHGVECTACGHCFTDANFEPVPSDDAATLGALAATEPWRPVMETQVEYRDRMLVWTVRPREQVIGPPFVMAGELLEAMREAVR